MDIELMKSRGDFSKNSMKIAPEVLHQNDHSLSDIMSEEIINRAPDKMLQIIDGFLILAWNTELIIINMTPHGVFDRISSGEIDHYKHIELEKNELQFLKLGSKYKIITLQEIGSDTTKTHISLVLEEINTRIIRFLKIDYNDGSTGADKKIVLSQLGVLVSKTRLSPSPLLKYRSIARIDHNTGKSYHVGIVVRKNGRWEVYSDFMLVYDWYDKAKQCVDVETDFRCFYLKFVNDSHLIHEKVPVESLKMEIRRTLHIWRNRISYDNTKYMKKPNVWGVILHNRVARYFKIYSQILNYQMFMMVSHRNMVSVYKMTSEKQNWQTHMLDNGTIRQMFIKRKPLERINQKKSNARLPTATGEAVLTVFERY